MRPFVIRLLAAAGMAGPAGGWGRWAETGKGRLRGSGMMKRTSLAGADGTPQRTGRLRPHEGWEKDQGLQHPDESLSLISKEATQG